jgi:hypothetical protein
VQLFHHVDVGKFKISPVTFGKWSVHISHISNTFKQLETRKRRKYLFG